MAQFSSDQIIIALIAIFILFFNVAMIYSLLSGSAQRQLLVLRRMFEGMRRPWGKEEDSLRELRRRIERLPTEESHESTDG